jgi:hypothetical protein
MLAICLALCLSPTGLSPTGLSPSVPQEPGKAQQPRELTMLSLQPFVTPREAVPVPPFDTLLASHGDGVDLIGASSQPQFETEYVNDLIRQLHGKEAEEGAFGLFTGGGGLLVLAPKELGRQIADELQQVIAAVGRPIELELAVYAWDGPPPRTVLAGDELGKTLAGRVALAHGTATTRSGVRAGIDQLRWSRYVRTSEGEVAQKASASRPVVDAFAEGVAALIEPHALVDRDDVALFAQFAIGQRREVVNMATGVADRPSLDFPRLDSAFGVVAATVPDGGALLVPLSGHAQAGARLLLVLTVHAGARAPGPASVSVLPVSALLTSAATRMPRIRGLATPLADERGGADDPAGAPIAEDLLLELLQASGGNREAATIQIAGGFAFVRGDDATRRAAPALLRTLQDRWLANVELRCTADLREVDGSSAFAAPAGAGTVVLHDVALACLPGHVSVLFRGVEQSLLTDQMIEIAQEATGLVPVVQTAASGLWLRARPALADGGVRPDLLLQFVHSSPPAPRRVEPQGMVMLADTGQARFLRDQLLPPGADVVLGDAPVLALDGRSWRPTLRVRAQTK